MEQDMDQIDQVEQAAQNDQMDQGAAHVRLVEALLFASASPLSVQDLHNRMPDGADVGGALMSLQQHYQGRGIELVERDGTWAFRTALDLAESLQMEKDVSRKLSRAALETMAIVAYHQPITRAEIENIRGVATHRGTIDALIEMDWIKPGRRRETPGRPLTWMTTATFLDHFSLESIMDLPGLDDLKASGLLDRRPAIDAIPEARDLFDGLEQETANDDSDISSEDLMDDESLEELPHAVYEEA